MNKFIGLSLAGITIMTTAGCGKAGSGVNLASPGYNAPTTARLMRYFLPEAYAATTSINDFKFCVREMKLLLADGSAVKKDGSDAIKLKIGLVDLGDGSKPVTWGNADIPTDTVVKSIHVKVHQDPEICKVDYSAMINGTPLTKDLEFKFSFKNEQGLKAGGTVTLALTNLVSKMEQAVLAGKFNDTQIDEYLDGSFEDKAETD